MRIKDEIRNKIIEDYRTKKHTYATLAAKYGISRTSIGRIVNPEYEEREREKSRIRQRSYEQPKPKYMVNLRFSEKEQDLIDKIKSVDNIQAYVKNLIIEDIKKG